MGRPQQATGRRQWRRLFAPLLGACVLSGSAGALVVLSATPAAAAVLTVTRFDDPVDNTACNSGVDCSLRQAVNLAAATAGADVVQAPAGTYTLTLNAPNCQLAHTAGPQGDLTIQGTGGVATVTANAATCTAGRIINYGSGTLTLQNLVITGGQSAPGPGGGVQATGNVVLTKVTVSTNSTNAANADGGGIAAGTITLTSSTVTNNHALGATSSGGGMNSVGMSITGSTISNNTATSSGGGLRSRGGTFTMTGSTVSGNSTPNDGGGLLLQGTTMSITNSTIDDNHVTGTGSGGGFFRDASGGQTLTISGTTISNNTVLGGGGGASDSLVPVVMYNSTVTNNSATAFVGGFAVNATAGTPALALAYVTIASNSGTTSANLSVVGNLQSFGTVVADPLGGGGNCQILAGVTTSNGWNYEQGTNTCGFTNVASGDVNTGASPSLGALAANGGPTLTRLPATGSPLLDKIPAANCAGPGAPIPTITSDQRGLARPGFALCDIGAVEIQASTTTIVVARFTG